jgi:Flagellar hook-length control protein FliK
MRSLTEEQSSRGSRQQESGINHGQHSSVLSSQHTPADPPTSSDRPVDHQEDPTADPANGNPASAAPPAQPGVNDQLTAWMSALGAPAGGPALVNPQTPGKGQPTPAPPSDEQASPVAIPLAVGLPGQPFPLGGARRGKVDPKLPVKEEQRTPAGFAVAVPVQEQPLPPVQLSGDMPVQGLQAPLDRDPAPQTPLDGAPGRKAEAAAPPVQDKSTQPEDLTFAARVQPVGSVQKSTGLTSATTAPTPAVNSKKVIESDVQDAPRAADPGLAAGRFAAAFESNGRLTPPPPDAPSTPSKPVEAAVPVMPALPKPAAQPLKDLSLQLSQPGVEKVEIRMVQQSGELHVAVRTGDSEMAHGLRQNLPELVGHLEDNGFHTEAWRPGVSAAPGPGHVPESHSSASGNPQSSDDSQSRSGSRQQDAQHPRQQSNRPAWVEELESSTGEIYGIGS